MHLVRRAVFRAVASPSASLIYKSRPITTSSQIVLRPKAQGVLFQYSFRRSASDDAEQTDRDSTRQMDLESADGETDSVQSAMESAMESAITSVKGPGASMEDSAGSGRMDPHAALAPPRTQYLQRELTPTKGIYIGNLLFDVTAEDLRREFEPFGVIVKTTIAADARGLSKGFGYIEFETIDQAIAAIQAKNQTVLEGRRMLVNFMTSTNRTQEKNPPSKTLFIGNLAFEMSDADLNKLFREIRNVIDVRVAIDRRTGQPRGFAHADFVDVDSASKAMEVLHGREIYGRTLRVDFSGASRDRNPDIKPRREFRETNGRS